MRLAVRIGGYAQAAQPSERKLDSESWGDLRRSASKYMAKHAQVKAEADAVKSEAVKVEAAATAAAAEFVVPQLPTRAARSSGVTDAVKSERGVATEPIDAVVSDLYRGDWISRAWCSDHHTAALGAFVQRVQGYACFQRQRPVRCCHALSAAGTLACCAGRSGTERRDPDDTDRPSAPLQWPLVFTGCRITGRTSIIALC